MLAETTSVLVIAALFGALLAFLEKVPCRSGAWNSYVKQLQDACSHTDVYPLYYNEGLAAGKVRLHRSPRRIPRPDRRGDAGRRVAGPADRRPLHAGARVLRRHSDLAGHLCGGRSGGYRAGGPGRRWQALLVALAPALVLSAFVNWDLIAMAFAALGLAAWAAKRTVAAGVLFGLAVATKFYPLVLFGPLLLLCLRAGRMREFWVTFSSAAVAWLAVNLPVMIIAPAGWATFYEFSKTRPADWGSISNSSSILASRSSAAPACPA